LYPAQDVPDPVTLFPDFVRVLFSIRFLLAPQTIGQAIQLFLHFTGPSLGRFLLYEAPIMVGRPLLFLESLLEISSQSSQIWTELVADLSSVDCFFNFYLSMLTPLEIVCNWTHHLLLAELFFRILSVSTKINPNCVNLTSKFYDAVRILLPVAPLEVKISIIRWITKLTKLTFAKTEKKEVRARMKSLLAAVSQEPLALVYFVDCVLSDSNNTLNPKFILSSLKVNSVRNIFLIEKCANKLEPLPVIVHLIRGALYDKVFHRAGFQVARGLIVRFSEESTIRDWVTNCVRQLLIFVPLAHQRQKYRGRCVRICESLSQWICPVHWLRVAILSVVWALTASKTVPVYFPTFFQLALPDENCLTELELFLKGGADLKTFPFENGGTSLVNPPCVDVFQGTGGLPILHGGMHGSSRLRGMSFTRKKVKRSKSERKKLMVPKIGGKMKKGGKK
jgi:hypothetical protein